jgi:hypothetical protein
LLLDSGSYQKVDGLLRNWWSASSGIGGRFAPEFVVVFPRIMHIVGSRLHKVLYSIA